MAYPPKRGPEGRYYSEVVTLTTATFPEREGIHLLMQVSMRNWGSLTGTRSENQRTIDVFMPSYGATEGNYANWRHSSFACVRRGFERAEGEANGTERWVWRHDQSQKVMKVLRGFAGLEWVNENADVEPIEAPDSYAILPRLGTVHGDDELPGGAGLGWSDRHDFLLSLGPHLEEIGLKPSGPMTAGILGGVPRLNRRTFRGLLLAMVGDHLAVVLHDPTSPIRIGRRMKDVPLGRLGHRLESSVIPKHIRRVWLSFKSAVDSIGGPPHAVAPVEQVAAERGPTASASLVPTASRQPSWL